SSTPNNLGTVKKLHACLFPVVYSPSFFDSLLNPAAHPEDYNKLVFYQDLPVGVVVCRLELSDAATPKTLAEAAAATKLYIMTLGVLVPYRHQGLGSKLIHHVLTSAAATHPRPKVDSVYLHVQVGNDDARRFWEKWGFQVKDTVADYYRKIEPRDAWLLERTVEPQLSEGASASA
ncbi:uncharacterized protein RHOBADRAFT_15208, partial [Rhodotorula graminis WP1]